MAENNMQPPQNMANGNENLPNFPPLTITTDVEAVLEQNLPEQGADKPLAAAEGPETPNYRPLVQKNKYREPKKEVLT